MSSPNGNGEAITHRYDFVYLFDITDGNPNGDPDAGNMPRLDPETGQGLVTDVCLKRKVRNYIGMAKPDVRRYRIFVRERAVLNEAIEEAYEQSEEVKAAVRAWDEWKSDKKKPRPEVHYDDVARRWMCDNFFDIRAFGAVMTTGDEKEIPGVKSKLKMTAGQVRGPVQLGIARSLHPIVSHQYTVTRCAVTNEKDLEKERTMGRKFAVPYGLYRVHGYISPGFAAGFRGTGFADDDLHLFKQALDQMFEQDKSAARANMRPAACIAFKHEGTLGNARADKLFARVRCTPKPGVQPLPGEHADGQAEGRPPRSFGDYELRIDEKDLPQGVTIERWIDWE
jgi:CRISPR-associated protein Csd2